MINKLITFSKDKKKLFSNFVFLNILNITNLVLPLITLPYLVRVLSIEKFGLVMFAQAFILFFVILVDYGFNYSATREISINRENKEKITEIFSVVIQIKIFLVLISVLLMILIVNFFDKFNSDRELYYLTFLYVIGQAMFPAWYFQGKEDMKYITYLNILAKSIFTISIFIFVKDNQDYLYIPLLNGLGYVIAGFLSIWLLVTKYDEKFRFYSFETTKKIFKESSGFFFSRISVSLYTTSNIVVLGLFTNNVTVGVYSIAEKLYNALKGMYGPVSTALYPYISLRRDVGLYKKIFYIFMLINVFSIFSLWWLSPWLIELVSGKYILESVNAFRLLVLIAIIVIPSSLLGYSLLAALGYQNYANYSVIIASLIHMFGLIVLYLFDEITLYSVIYMLAITESVVFSIRLYAIKKHNLWNLK